MSDPHDLYKLSRDLENFSLQLEAIGPEVAKAKVVRDYDSDRRKNLLAEFVSPLLANTSATAAESVARSDAEYQRRFKELSLQLNAAYATIARESGLHARFEAARSILSCQKAAMAL